MLRTIILPTILSIVLASTSTRANPIDTTQNLEPRDNDWHLKCSNAPNVVAGYQLNQTDVVLSTDLPPSGSNQAWMKYLWCTPGTETYTFFDFGMVDPYPSGYFNLYHAFNQFGAYAHDQIASMGDGPLTTTYYSTPNTNVKVVVFPSKGKLTYGILSSAMYGLATAAENYDKSNYPMVFQINDGPWGEVAIGAAGLEQDLDGSVKCFYEMKGGDSSQWQQCEQIGNKQVIN